VVVLRDPDAVQTICDFLETFGFTVEVEPELEEGPQAVDPVPLTLASYLDVRAIVDQARRPSGELGHKRRLRSSISSLYRPAGNAALGNTLGCIP
jgi:hypothetical protein